MADVIDEGERLARERRGRRAIGWGAFTILLGFAIGAVLAFLPVATGMRFNPPFETSGFGGLFIAGSLGVSAFGLGLVIYGLVMFGRSRPHPPHEPERAHRGPRALTRRRARAAP